MKKTLRVIALALAVIMAFGSSAAFAAAKSPLYVVIGDSIAAGTGLINPSAKSYGAIVANSNGYRYINHAVPGYTSASLLNLLSDSTVSGDIKAADIISISIGGNDFFFGIRPAMIVNGFLGDDYSGFDSIIAKTSANFAAIIKKIKNLNPDVTILVQTVYNPRYDFLQETYQQAVDRINKVFREYLAKNPGSFEIVDVAAAFAGHEEYIAIDATHPNAAGHKAIARLLLAKLKALGLGTATLPIVKASSLFKRSR